MSLIQKIFGSNSSRELKKIYPLQQKVLALEETYKAMSEEELRGNTERFRERLRNGETLDDLLPDAFAACREAADRVLGMRHFPVQIIGGIVLHQGRIAEMKTGEGKTLVATLAAYLNALPGEGVHIVTVNDYLARRDSEWMGKLYRYLGLTVGLVVHGVENDDRRAAYNADITYGTNNEFGFDYLRDNMVIYKENKVQREFNFAIVDEVDSILIDEARTPLIISGRGEKSTDMYERADRLAKSLTSIKFKEMDTKADNDQYDCDYIIDEKAKTATLTQQGVKKAEQYFGLENLMDPDNVTILHHVNQAIKAHGVMHRDPDYIVSDDGQVIIVDEFTGRLMYGRRYNEGLHQAIEAKEGVKVAHENRTLATITFQNYFRLYKKLSGMTGTALTEEPEFNEIYKLDVIEIPTNKPVARTDESDLIYKTEKAKLNAVIEQIVECHERHQPVLVGTITIDKSEQLSSALKRRGIKHEVLNAKYHEKEAQIIAQAGKKDAVTIATNMAGRGTDIVLGGNAEYLAKAEMRKNGFEEELIDEATSFSETDNEEILNSRKTYAELLGKYKEMIAPEADEVREAGGLYILGTERHESRRIDNQLRGRAGRQGDPGVSRFFISLEDDLMRLFGGERIYNIMETLGVSEDTPIESKMISRQIEEAQRRVEGRNFSIRKSVLQYDDVMNRQREIMYGQRNQVLNGENLKDKILKMIEDVIDEEGTRFLSSESPEEWNLDALRDAFLGWLTTEDDFRFSGRELDQLSPEDIKQQLIDRAHEKYEEREKRFGSETMRELERVILLRTVDTYWMDHIDAMEELKNGIHLRAYGQHDPVIEYRNEGYDMFNAMTSAICSDTARLILSVEVRREEDMKRKQIATPSTESRGGDAGSEKPKPAKAAKKPGRNDPCPCGSGKKYKFCCGAPGKENANS